MEAMSTGIATFDFDGDGLIDIYFPNGAPLPGDTPATPPRHALYQNLGGWRFRDVTIEARAVCTSFGLGITTGDYDNDGWDDIYLNNFGANVLFHNNGDGTFSAATQRAGVARGQLVGAGACFFDKESDGNLDLYVGNYIDLNCDEHVPHVTPGGLPRYPSPVEYAPVPDTLYGNNGDGSFSDVSVESGIASVAGRAMGMTCADYDADGDVDVFVCNDVQENYLFQNDGQGRFRQIAKLNGFAYNGNGDTLANMAVDAGDYDNDGLLDLFSTNYQGELPVLFHNLDRGLLHDATLAANAGASCFRHVNWGCGFADLDNDTHRDLFIGNGHVDDNIELRIPTAAYHAECIVLKNNAGRFEDVSHRAGDGLRRKVAARGVALDDLDNDGDVDAVVLASREHPLILRNLLAEAGDLRHWLQVRLCGVGGNRNGIGARVRVIAGDLTLADEVHSGRAYQSHFGSRLHFGLGPHEQVDRVEIYWNGGQREIVQGVAANRFVTVVERATHAGSE